jgi:protein-L-isoaspartate(D-aspartate) O-methyltransferase
LRFADPYRKTGLRTYGIDMTDFAHARRMMVEGQVRTNDVTEPRLLAAMLALPREAFVPSTSTDVAYLDRDLPVQGSGATARCLLKPMVLAKLIQAAAVSESDRVLDVACATGYSSAVLAHLASQVVALEEDAVLARAAEDTLRALGIANVAVRTGPLIAGAPADGPYDVILLNGTAEIVPQALCTQLRDGGRLVCVLSHGAVARAMLYQSIAGDISGRAIFDAAAPLLPGFTRPAAFVF